jgi:hypothetical protein
MAACSPGSQSQSALRLARVFNGGDIERRPRSGASFHLVATVDRLASDYGNDGQFPRSFVLCAGNTANPDAWNRYPASLSTNGVRDPVSLEHDRRRVHGEGRHHRGQRSPLCR